jgi:hypothetical protein
MKKKMVHGLLIPVAHTTPINHNDAPLPEIVHGFHHPSSKDAAEDGAHIIEN